VALSGHPQQRLWFLDRAACCNDLLLGRTGDFVHGNVQLNRNVTLPKNLDLLVLAHSTLGDEVDRGHLSTLRVQLGELLEVHDLVLDAERVLEPAQLRRAHDTVQVSTLESDAHLVTSLRSLGTAAGRLTLRALTTTDASTRGLGTGGGA
jgi:hypothetical protein